MEEKKIPYLERPENKQLKDILYKLGVPRITLTEEEKIKKELGFPDKFFCDCGKEISESTLVGCGMCDECYIKWETSRKDGGTQCQ